MEEAPVTAATGALGPVVAKLSTLLRRHGEYKLRRQTRNDVKLIRSELKSIHSILWVIWEREDLDAEGKKLRMEAWRLADDMNDAIDDFILSMKRSSNNFVQSKIQPSPFQDLKRMAIDVSQRFRNKWKMDLKTTALTTVSRTKTTVDSGPTKRPRVIDPYVHKDISELVWMEKPRDDLIDHLVGEKENTPKLKMASILGAAGSGKTTLARLVYEGIEDKFQGRAFVSVTSSRNVMEVLISILRQVAAGCPAVLLAGTKAATEKHLICILSNFLKDKRYLVIIDDIWHWGEWKTIKKALPDNNLGSTIVTTSRDNAILDKWCDSFDALVYKIGFHGCHGKEIYSMKLLSRMIAMQPNGMVGEGFNDKHHIVHMCDGMPLALVCMISALAKEREHQEQQGLCVRTCDVQDRIEEQVKRNGIQNTPGFEALVESLELGYNHLPHQMLKTCLLYCGIYPQSHGFTRDGLVRRWIAEGFACKEEEAKDYFDELVRRLILQGDELSFNQEYRMHPMMQNYLRWKLPENDFITCSSDGIPSSPIGRLCIDYWPSSDEMDPCLSGISWQQIRSLAVFKDAERVPYKHLQHLRVLDVQGGDYCALENQHLKDMCGLLRLRHLLGLSGSGITEIPKEIIRLQYLETLELTKTNITRLPGEIGELKQLKTLDVSQTESWNGEPLREMDTESCDGELPRETEMEQLLKKTWNLQHLETLRFRQTTITLPWQILRTLKKLKTLELSDNKGLALLPSSDIDAIGELQQLKNLDLSGSNGITMVLKEIGRLQHLETLELAGTGI